MNLFQTGHQRIFGGRGGQDYKNHGAAAPVLSPSFPFQDNFMPEI
jgi:hypothetical protein